MIPTRPYFLRAFYEWILDNSLTPYILVNATSDFVQVPQSFVKDGEIVLDLSPLAIIDLVMDNDFVSFSAKFEGEEQSIYIPMIALIGIYAKENGQGMMFPEEPSYNTEALSSDLEAQTPSEEKNSQQQPTKKMTHLKVVK